MSDCRDTSPVKGRQMQVPIFQRGSEVQVLAAGLLADMEMLSLATISLMFGIVLSPHLGNISWTPGLMALPVHTCVRHSHDAASP